MEPRRSLWLIFLLAGLVLGGAVGMAADNWIGRGGEPDALPTEQAEIVPSPEPTATATPVCVGDEVEAGVSAVVAALEKGDTARAERELEVALSAYVPLKEQPVCALLAQDLLGLQALVVAAKTWESALESGSTRQATEAEQMAQQAARLASNGGTRQLAADLVDDIESHSDDLSERFDPGRVITSPQTIATELAGGLYPLCGVNTLIKPFLFQGSGDPVGRVSRLEVYSDTLLVIAGGRLLAADLERVRGPSPAVFLEPLDAGEDSVVAGSSVGELVDLTRALNGDLLLLEKSGRLLRRTPAGEWSLDRQVEGGEVPVAVAPYADRSYLLDPASNQIWRHVPEAGGEGHSQAYFLEEAIRDVSRAVDLAIDGAIYVARWDGWVRRYYVGVEDSGFRMDADLGAPTTIFLPDDPDSTLVYVVDGEGRRVLGLDRETGSYRLGFMLQVEGAAPLTGGEIRDGRLYLTDGDTLFAYILSPTPVPAQDCPAQPFPPSAPLGQPELAKVEWQFPVDASLPMSLPLYPGGRWPSIGYGVLDAVVFAGLPYSSTVRAMADGTIERIEIDPPTLLDTDLGSIN